MRTHIVVNTIGLTGAEMLLAEFARFPDVLTLPGQNFIQDQHCLYRTHDYGDLDPEAVFDRLGKHLLMRSGRCWMGLTKNMTSSERASYPREAHRSLFLSSMGASRDVLDCIECYAETFYEAWGAARPDARFVCYFSHNLVLQQNAYPRFAERIRVVDFGNEVHLWLAMISQRMTWNCIDATKFYIVQRLLLALFSKRGYPYKSVDLREYLAEPASTVAAVRTFLGMRALPTGGSPPAVPGFISMDRSRIEGILADAEDLKRVYSGNPLVACASGIDTWSRAFLDDPQNVGLLDRYLTYWNSTSHTNFDWVGPLEELIIERCPVEPGSPGDIRRLSERFFHEQFELHSDNFAKPVVRVRHSLGDLESEIVVPRLPYFLRAAIAYLDKVCDSHEMFTHSYLPLRDTPMFRLLSGTAYRRKLSELGLDKNMSMLEDRVAQIEALVREHVGGPSWPFENGSVTP